MSCSPTLTTFTNQSSWWMKSENVWNSLEIMVPWAFPPCRRLSQAVTNRLRSRSEAWGPGTPATNGDRPVQWLTDLVMNVVRHFGTSLEVPLGLYSKVYGFYGTGRLRSYSTPFPLSFFPTRGWNGYHCTDPCHVKARTPPTQGPQFPGHYRCKDSYIGKSESGNPSTRSERVWHMLSHSDSALFSYY